MDLVEQLFEEYCFHEKCTNNKNVWNKKSMYALCLRIT